MNHLIKSIKLAMLVVVLMSLNSCILLGVYAVDQEAQYSENLPYSTQKVYDVVLHKLNENKNTKIT